MPGPDPIATRTATRYEQGNPRGDLLKKPRVRFCWECGRKLWGNHYVEMEIEGHKRILHKSCGKDIEEARKDANHRKS